LPKIRTLLLLAGDISVIFATFFAAAWFITESGQFWSHDFTLFLQDDQTLPRLAIACFSLVFALYFLGAYEDLRPKSGPGLTENLLLALGATLLIQALVSYTRTAYEVPRWLMLLGGAAIILTLSLWRMLYSKLLLRAAGRQRILLLGDSAAARLVAEHVESHPETGFTVIARLRAEPDVEPELASQIVGLNPDRIAVAGSIGPQDWVTRQLLTLSMQGAHIEDVGDLYETIFGRVSVDALTLNQLVFSAELRPKRWVVALQEVYGRLLAIVGLALGWPLMVLTAIAVRLDSEGPALLRQTRLGRGGKPFTFLKFRSMYVDADAKTGPVRAQENDPRITRVGKWIRLLRLDELPQLINVLRGELFLVGPRPEMPALESKLLADLPLYPQRHRIKPGITGWAQIHHEPEDSILSTKKKLEYDLYYIKHMGPVMDMLIIFHTLKAVLLRIGAR
jgi:exopolysaccharide biosynthesis polyprenyl glycosylphosphotransferase